MLYVNKCVMSNCTKETTRSFVAPNITADRHRSVLCVTTRKLSFTYARLCLVYLIVSVTIQVKTL